MQVAAALIVARLDGGWETSVRGRALTSLVFGPVDWTTTAGMIALTQLARTEGIDVRSLFVRRLQSLPRGGYCCCLHPLVLCALRLPNLDPDERKEFETWQADLERDAV